MEKIFLIFLIILMSCNQNGQKQKEIEATINELKMTIGVYKWHLNERGAAIESMSNYKDSLKKNYKYDSLIKVQKDQSDELSKLETELKIKQQDLDELLNNK